MTTDATPTTPDTIVLIHGLSMTPLSWEHWVDRYSSRGYKVHAPAWPGMEGDIEELRRDPSAVAGLGVTEIVDHYDAIIRDLDSPPIVMGHSFGGQANYRLYRRSRAVTDYKEFPERPHFTVGAPGWEEVADYALRWAVEHAVTDAHRPSAAPTDDSQ